MTDKDKEQRVIGIRHTLKEFKNEGLVDSDTCYPVDAVDNVKDKATLTAKRAYWLGARRGAIVVIDAFLNEDMVIEKDNSGNLEVTANIDKLNWEKAVNVTFGSNKIRVEKNKYRLDVKKHLGFK
jgi:hypothetical protein